MQTLLRVIPRIYKKENGFKPDSDPQRLLRTYKNLRNTRIQVTDINETWQQVKRAPV
jgi:hypothetical protein